MKFAVYKIENHHEKLITEPYGRWNPVTGLEDVRPQGTVLAQRRRDLMGKRFKASIVILHNDSVNHLDDYRWVRTCGHSISNFSSFTVTATLMEYQKPRISLQNDWWNRWMRPLSTWLPTRGAIRMPERVFTAGWQGIWNARKSISVAQFYTWCPIAYRWLNMWPWRRPRRRTSFFGRHHFPMCRTFITCRSRALCGSVPFVWCFLRPPYSIYRTTTDGTNWWGVTQNQTFCWLPLGRCAKWAHKSHRELSPAEYRL